jgi:nucleotide-binding universal stress UspA family protein
MAGRILVGVDGSIGSRTALRWAIEEATARGAVLDAVIVWESPYDFAKFYYSVDHKEIAERARERLLETIAEVAGPHPAVEVRPVVLEGDPAQLLCAWSDDADLIVVGSRGRGDFAGMLLGSVSTKCAHHSRCPVVIVPKDDKSAREGGAT